MPKRYEQIADDLLRQIAAGEFGQEGKLPTEVQLANEYRVSPGTVREALNVLRSKGLIETRHGKGSFLRMPDRDVAGIGGVADQELDAMVTLAQELGHLKRLPRTGWLRVGVDRPESVAEHSMRAAVLAWMIAGLEGADTERAAVLALFHDSQETRTTDLDHVASNYLHATSNEQITADQTAALPYPLAAALRALVSEYEGRASLEAECARDADKLEMLLQALDYRQQGYSNTGPFIQTAVAALRTPSGRRLGEAAIRVDPAAWWQAFTKAIAPAERPSENGQ
jgi:putative hydrolase of HD superfamily